MERTIKLLFTTLLVLMLGASNVWAEESMSLSTMVTPQNVDYNLCTRNYILTPENYFIWQLRV